jgi:hypothetical protein
MSRKTVRKSSRRSESGASIGRPDAAAATSRVDSSRVDASRRDDDGPVASGDQAIPADRWERFWFTAKPYHQLRPARILVAAIATIYSIGFIANVGAWFGPEGLLASERVGRLVVASDSTEIARWRFSLLYWIDSIAGLRIFAGAVSIAGIAVMFGFGGRLVAVALWLGVVSLANASWIVAPPGMIPLILGLGTLVIAGTGTRRDEMGESRLDSLCGLALRLNQTYVVLFLAAYALSCLFNESRIGQGLQRQALVAGIDFLAASPMLCRLIQGAVVFGSLAIIPVLLWLPGRRKAAVVAAGILWLVLAFFSGDWWYAGSLIAMATTFLDRSQSPVIVNSKSPDST